jgi:hypothetical protein
VAAFVSVSISVFSWQVAAVSLSSVGKPSSFKLLAASCCFEFIVPSFLWTLTYTQQNSSVKCLPHLESASTSKRKFAPTSVFYSQGSTLALIDAFDFNADTSLSLESLRYTRPKAAVVVVPSGIWKSSTIIFTASVATAGR